MNKMTTVIFVIIALIVGGIAGFMVERAHATAKMEAYKMTIQKQIDTIKMKSDDMMKSMATPEPTGMMMHGTPEPSGMMMEK